jgi:hypothetical protein
MEAAGIFFQERWRGAAIQMAEKITADFAEEYVRNFCIQEGLYKFFNLIFGIVQNFDVFKNPRERGRYLDHLLAPVYYNTHLIPII